MGAIVDGCNRECVQLCWVQLKWVQLMVGAALGGANKFGAISWVQIIGCNYSWVQMIWNPNLCIAHCIL